METEKLTLKDWQLYPNAKGSMSFKANDFMINNIEEFIIFREKNSGTILRSLDISKWKLQLRPIESLTEEEKKEFEEKFLTMHEVTIKDLGGINEAIAFLLDVLSFEKVISLINFFRSINIDIDGFIASGKAVAE